MVGVNSVKIEGGLIKYEVNNKFNIRVSNFRRGGGKKVSDTQAFSSLDKYVQEQNLQDAQQSHVRKLKKEENAQTDGSSVKQEACSEDIKTINVKTEGVKSETGEAA